MTTTLRDTFDIQALRQELIRDEGLVLTVYKDPGSGRAIGVGRNLDSQGLSADERTALGMQGGGGPIKGDELAKVLEATGGITNDQAMLLLDNDIADRCHQLDSSVPWWRLLSQVRQRVLINMAFEMGTHGMLQKQGTALLGMVRGQFAEAADAMEASPWGQHIPKRPHELAQMMRLDKPVDRHGNPLEEPGVGQAVPPIVVGSGE